MDSLDLFIRDEFIKGFSGFGSRKCSVLDVKNKVELKDRNVWKI